MARPAVPVLFLEAREAHGGDVQVLVDILKGLDPLSYQPIVACLPGGPVDRRTDLPAGAQVVTTSFGHSDTGSLVGNAASLAGTVLTLRRLIKRRGVRIVHSNNVRRALAVAVALKLSAPRRVRLVYHAHCEPQSSAVHRVARHLATRIWACSEFVRESYISAGVPPQRLALMSNGLDFTTAPAPDPRLRQRLSIPASDPVVALVGRLAPTKGQHLAVEALAESALPPSTHLLIVGDDAISDHNEGYKDRLEQRAKELGVHDRVHFVGFASDPSPYYLAADAVVIPSHREPFGLVALEAGAACRPIVAVASGGLIEILSEVAGLRLCERRPEAIAALLHAALRGEQDPPPSVVRDRLAQVYSSEHFNERVADELRRLAGGSDRSRAIGFQRRRRGPGPDAQPSTMTDSRSLVTTLVAGVPLDLVADLSACGPVWPM